MSEDIKFWRMNENNECYTTMAESDKLVDYLLENNLVSKETKIWLPFDTDVSRIYLAFKNRDFKNIIRTSLGNGIDFYHYEPEDYDVIISNPPFSGRTDLFRRLFAFKKPFIILQGAQMFNNQNVIKKLCKHSDKISFLLPRTRMRFMMFDEKTNVVKTSKTGASFYSFWFCFGFEMGGAFIELKDNDRETLIETMDVNGNIIEESHYNLFSE